MSARTDTKSPERAVARELRKIRAAHRGLVDRADAVAQMRRLAALRVRFEELTALIEADGGANADNLGLVAESRQVNRACSAIERELKTWWAVPPAVNPFLLMSEVRRAMLGRDRSALPPIGGAIEVPETLPSAVLIPRRQ